MPRIFDNINSDLLPALEQTLALSHRSDFCVGYFNLRGWKELDSFIERWAGGKDNCCRLLIGMQRLPQEELRDALSMTLSHDSLDNQTALRLKKKLPEDFRNQLTIGVPTNADETGLRRLAHQLKSTKVVVKLFLRYAIHAKLYLCFRPDPNNPITGFLGSCNLTLAGLSKQGELNVDVLDHDTTQKLARWFEDRWNDRWCVDITNELIQIIDESWAREEVIPPLPHLHQNRLPPRSGGPRRYLRRKTLRTRPRPSRRRPPLPHPRRGTNPRTPHHLLAGTSEPRINLTSMNTLEIIAPTANTLILPKNPVRVVGIDLGTTNSTLAEVIWSPESNAAPLARCLEVEQPTSTGPYIHVLVPSVVAIHNNTVLVGEEAKRLRANATLRRNKDIFYECKMTWVPDAPITSPLRDSARHRRLRQRFSPFSKQRPRKLIALR